MSYVLDVKLSSSTTSVRADASWRDEFCGHKLRDGKTHR